VDKLKEYRWSSYWYLWNPRKRPEFMDISGALEHAGGLLESEGLLKEGSFESLRLEGRELREANELRWENLLERMLSTLQKNDNAISSEKKSAQWKVWIAVVLKSHTAATNVWIADKLNMGAPQSVSMLTSRFKQQKQDRAAAYLKFTQNITK
jgi:hypothetical protein